MPEIPLISGVNPIFLEFLFHGFALSLRWQLRLMYQHKGC
jgi:hypothetical protein